MERNNRISATSSKEEAVVIQHTFDYAEACYERAYKRTYTDAESRLVTSLLRENIAVLKKIDKAIAEAQKDPSNEPKTTKSNELKLVREEIIRSINHMIKPKINTSLKDHLNQIKSKATDDEPTPPVLKK